MLLVTVFHLGGAGGLHFPRHCVNLSSRPIPLRIISGGLCLVESKGKSLIIHTQFEGSEILL